MRQPTGLEADARCIGERDIVVDQRYSVCEAAEGLENACDITQSLHNVLQCGT